MKRSDRVPPFVTLQTLATVLDFDITGVLNVQKAEAQAEGDQDIMSFRQEKYETIEAGDDGYSLIPLTTS